jgi:hypothetical protein
MALVRRSDAKTLYCATELPNAHSAEILPDGNIVVVCSGEKGFLRVFAVDQDALSAGTLQPSRVLGKDVPLPWGHGVVWDRKRNCLWALGGSEMLQLHYGKADGQPTLTVAWRNVLPEGGGHDLYPLLGEDDRLMVSTGTKTWLFDPTEKTFAEFTRVPHEHVKGMSRLPAHDLLVTVIGERNNHGQSLLFSAADGTETRVPVPGATFYKARWCVPNDFSYPKDGE